MPSPRLIDQAQPAKPPFLSPSDPWVEQVFASLSPRERIAQLIHVAGWSNRDEAHTQEQMHKIRRYGIGGIIFFQGDPLKQAELTNQYQAASKVPLLISIDAEWGLAMRLQRSVQFPYAMALGAGVSDQLIYQMGAELARQCRRLGVHMNFAPCVDLNTEPANPVIGFRAFGEDPEAVSACAYAYMQGMQDQGVLAVAKHFPGHGDTDLDSHFILPTLPHDRERLDEIELYPYRRLIPLGLGAIMTGHLRVPALDNRPYHGATLSASISTQLLQQEMGFEGLVVTDALDMKAVANHFPPGIVDREALLAGNDLLLFSVDVEAAIREIESAMEAGQINQAEIDRRCRKVLMAKRWAGLHQYQPVETHQLIEALNPPRAYELVELMASQSIQAFGFAPESLTLHSPLASIALIQSSESDQAHAHHQLDKGAGSQGLPFQTFLEAYGEVDAYQVAAPFLQKDLDACLAKIPAHQFCLLSLHGLAVKARDRFGLSEEMIEAVAQIMQARAVILVLFNSKHLLPHLRNLDQAKGILFAWQESAFMQEAAARKLFD